MTAFLLLQLADSAFPTGGFAHSAGLEAAAQLGEIAGAADLARFCEESLWQAGLGALPFVRAAHEDPSDLRALDARCHAFLASHVANRASRTQGRAFASTVARIFPDPALAQLEQSLRSKAVHGHLAPVFGAALRALDTTTDEALRLYLHQSLRGVTSAAVRLGLLGPHEAQRLQHDLGPRAEHVLAACAALPVDAATQPAPLLDLFGAAHDRLYARLFQS